MGREWGEAVTPREQWRKQGLGKTQEKLRNKDSVAVGKKVMSSERRSGLGGLVLPPRVCLLPGLLPLPRCSPLPCFVMQMCPSIAHPRPRPPRSELRNPIHLQSQPGALEAPGGGPGPHSSPSNRCLAPSSGGITLTTA